MAAITCTVICNSRTFAPPFGPESLRTRLSRSFRKPDWRCIMKKQKIIIVEFDHDLIDPDILIAYTADGGRINLYPCVVPEKRRTHGTLYSDKRRLFFSLTRRGLHQIFEHFTPAMRISGCKCHNGERGNLYPTMRDYGNVACHLIILLSFRGPRPVYPDGKRAEADHKNGDVTNFALDNLEWVHPDENSWRSRHVLQILRAKGIDPATYTGHQMDKWFALFRAYEAANRPPIHIPTATILRDFDLFAFSDRFTLVNPDTLMLREMSRHMEY